MWSHNLPCDANNVALAPCKQVGFGAFRRIMLGEPKKVAHLNMEVEKEASWRFKVILEVQGQLMSRPLYSQEKTMSFIS